MRSYAGKGVVSSRIARRYQRRTVHAARRGSSRLKMETLEARQLLVADLFSPTVALNSVSAAADGQIQGAVWNDLDSDGQIDAEDGEAGIPGRAVYLDLNRDGLFDSDEPTQETGPDGTYVFADLEPGTYRVAQTLVPAWEQTFPAESNDPPDPAGVNVSKLSQVTSAAITGSAQNANDIWGYVSPSGREYAIIGLSRGTGYVEVTDPRNPQVIGFLPGADEPGGSGIQRTAHVVAHQNNALCHDECETASIWRDIKVYDEFAYATNETGGGLQIIDLREIDNGTVSVLGTVTDGGLRTAHNITINPDSGHAYLTGANIARGGLVIFDLATNPQDPQLVGVWSERYLHDAELHSYTSGPFAGREIAFGFGEGEGLKIIDVTDKSNPVTLSTFEYPNVTYAHYGALSEDQRFLFVNDELDEMSHPRVSTTTTYVIDVQDLENPSFVTSFTNGLPAIDHNLRIRGDYLFEANYRSGLRVFDVSDVNSVTEVGHYDTFPADDATRFNGAWGVYTDFPSGVVVVSDIERGLFVLDATDAMSPDLPANANQTGQATFSTTLLPGATVSASEHRTADQSSLVIVGPQLSRLTAAGAIAASQTAAATPVVAGQSTAELMWHPGEDGTVRLAWQTMIRSGGPVNGFRSIVDAYSGEVLEQTNLADLADDTRAVAAEVLAHTVFLGDGEIVDGVNFGTRTLAETGEIRGIKWNDADGDGAFEPDDGETPLADWQIFLDLNRNGQLDDDEPSEMTDANGEYVFTNVEPGTYDVSEVFQAGWEQVFPVPPPTPNVEIFGMLLDDDSQPSIESETGDPGHDHDSEHERIHALTTNFYLPPQYHLVDSTGFLSAPSNDDADAIARQFLTDHAAELGMTAEDFASLRLTDRYTSDHTGTTHLYYRQTLNGLDVVNAEVNVNVMADGRVLNVGSSLVAGLEPERYPIATQPELSAIEALTSFAGEMDWTFDSEPTLVQAGQGLAQTMLLSSAGISLEDIPARLQYVPTPGGGVELAWRLEVQTTDREHWFNASVSAQTGELAYMSDWVNDASYNVFAFPKESPSDGARTIEIDPQDTTASPFGWHDTDGVAGAEFTDTRGNNVFAQEDADANNSGGFRPDGGAALNFDFPLDLTLAPNQYQSAAITNLFYWNNILHDVHYQYGFNEAAGNFQTNNYGNGGLGNDAVLADAQDGSDLNNANFSTPPDGEAPRMQQFIFTSATPDRDSDLDAGIIVHEYGHGVTNRLTGGPGNSDALNAIQSGSMGEGWSDWWSLMFAQTESDTANSVIGIGTYALGQSPDGTGIRRFPYSFDMSVNPLTYANFGATSGVHANGEIWASVLWDLNWLLIEGNALDAGLSGGQGFDADLYNGTGGNNVAMQLVADGLKLQPANPSYLDARDAILAADQALTGGENQLAIWKAFARRGMGFSADDGGSGNATNVTAAFDLPSTSEGVVLFDKDVYHFNETVTIEVSDLDLTADSVNVVVESTGGDTETVALASQGAGVYRGTIPLNPRTVNAENGVLNVREGETIEVTYADADDGTGNPAEATNQASIIRFEPVFLENGSFETGDFTGWTVNQPNDEFVSWRVTGAGQGGGFLDRLARTQPQDGEFVAWNDFNGAGPLELTMHQDIAIPATPEATLSWQERIQWDFTIFLNRASQPRVHQVELRNPDTGELLEVLETFLTGTRVTNPTGDTGWQTRSADLSAFAGQTVRLVFQQDIPQNLTGLGQIEFDDVKLDVVLPIPHVVEVAPREVVTGIDFGNRQLEATAPNVIDSSILDGDVVVDDALVYTVQFDENIEESVLDPSDVTVFGDQAGPVTPSNLSYDSETFTLSVELGDLPEDVWTLTLLSGDGRFESVDGRDLDGEVNPDGTVPSGNGIPGGDFVIQFTTDHDTQALATPLTPVLPLGSLVYESSAAGLIHGPDDTDLYTVNLEDGQTITLAATSAPELLATISLRGPGGETLATQAAASAGAEVVLQTIATARAGEYTVEVAGVRAAPLSLANEAWVAQGPGPTINGQVENVTPNNEVVGAIHTVVAHPTDADILWLGGTNGGIWRTENATAASPHWQPLTDDLSSLSIGALSLDPGNADRLAAGIGRYSSFGIRGGELTGLLLSEDAGDTWTEINDPLLVGENISGVVLRGDTIVASANFFSGGGLFRSTDNGATWSEITGAAGTGLPAGSVHDLVEDPSNSNRLYAALAADGIYRSDDLGATWVNVSQNDPGVGGLQDTITTGLFNNNTEMSVASDGRIFVGVLRAGQVDYIGFSDDAGASWTEMDIPSQPQSGATAITGLTPGSPITINSPGHGLSSGNRVLVQGVTGTLGANGNFRISVVDANNFTLLSSNDSTAYAGGGTWVRVSGLNPRQKPGGQGTIHFAILADPNDSSTVYIGGDRQDFPNIIGASGFTGNLWRGDTTVAATGGVPSPQWEHLTHRNDVAVIVGGGTANSSAPHADAREMVFDADGNLIEVDDGGIYRRTSPTDNTGDWFSIIGDLQTTEFHDIAYDTVSNIIIGGAQDTGTPEQISPGSTTWNSVSTADGGDVAVSVDPNNPAQSVRYSSFQFLGSFRRRVIDANNNVLSTVSPLRTVAAGGDPLDVQFVTPVVVNAIDPSRLIIGGENSPYESFDQGDNLTDLSPGVDLGVNADAVAYGGRRLGVDNPDVLYVGSGNSVHVRQAAAGPLSATAYPGGFVRDVVLDPNDWMEAFVADSNQVFQTTNAGTAWGDVTGNLLGLGATEIRSIEYVASPLGDRLLAGTNRGVFVSEIATIGAWSELAAGLPNAPVFELDYDPQDDLLVAGTLGRGAWTLAGASGIGENGGSYGLQLILNAALEAESHAGTGNNTAGDAQDLDPSMITLGANNGSRAAVLGTADDATADYYRFTLPDGDSASLALTGLSPGNLTLELFDATETQLIAAQIPAANTDQVVNNYLNTFLEGRGESYLIRVAGAAQTDYSLVITRNSDFDTESNNTSEQAQEISEVGAALGHVTDTDDDWYQLQVNQGDSLELAAQMPGSAPGEFVNVVDLGLELFAPSSSETPVATSLGAGDVTLDHVATETGTYRIRAFSEQETAGEYFLTAAGATGASRRPAVVSGTPNDGVTLSTFPTVYTLDFSESLLADLVSPGALLIGGLPATAVQAVDGNTFAFAVDPAANTGDGLYTVELLQDQLVDLQNQGNLSHQATFFFDTAAPRVTSTSFNGNALPDPAVFLFGPLTFVAEFDEELQAPLGPEDVVVTDVSTNATFQPDAATLDATTFTAEFDTPLPEGQYTLTLISGDGAFEDLVGNDLDGEPLGPNPDGTTSGDGTAGGDYVVGFSVDTDLSQASAFLPLAPLGSLVYASQQNQRSLNFAGDEDRVEFFVPGNHLVSVKVTPSDPGVTLSVDGVNAPGPGQPVVLGVSPNPASQTLQKLISGDGPTLYTVDVVLNAEQEGVSGDSSPANPVSLDASLLTIGSGRYAVIGNSVPQAEQPEIDLYTLDLTGKAGLTLEVALAGAGEVDFSGETLELLDASGENVLATATATPLGVASTSYDLGILDFTIPSDGEFQLRLTSTTAGDYSLLVTESLQIETEDNNELTDALRTVEPGETVLGHLNPEPGSIFLPFFTGSTTAAVAPALVARAATTAFLPVGTSVQDLSAQLGGSPLRRQQAFVTAAATNLIEVNETESNNTIRTANPVPLGFGEGQDPAVDVRGSLTFEDVDFFTVELNAGDILGASADTANGITLRDSNGIELITSFEDATFLHPDASPLPGGGEAVLSWVVDTSGTYHVGVEDISFGNGTGDYLLNLRVFRPELETQVQGNHQILFLDFDGADIDTGIFGQTGQNTTLSPLTNFLGGWGLGPGDEDAVIDAIVAVVEENLSADLRTLGNNGDFDATGIHGQFDIEIHNSRDHVDSFGQTNVSRVIVGGTIAELGIPTIGIAESIDVGNFETEESAVVLLDLLSAPASNSNSLNQFTLDPSVDIIDLIGVGVGNIVAHEAGHFFANWHTDRLNDTPDLMDQGGDLNNTLGLGPDNIFGSADDVDVDFGNEPFDPVEGFQGTQNTLNAIAFGLSTGTMPSVEVGPTVLAIDPVAGPLERLDITEIEIEFSEPITADPALDPANYLFLEAGPNGDFEDGAGDDLTIPVTPAFDGSTKVTLALNLATEVLPFGNYQLTIAGNSSIEDLDGNPLNSTTGSGDGVDEVHQFEVIHEFDDQGDLFRVELDAGSTYAFSTSTPLAGLDLLGHDLDLSLFLFSPDGQPILGNAGSDGEEHPRIEFQATETGTHFIQVTSTPGIGEYLLHVEELGAASLVATEFNAVSDHLVLGQTDVEFTVMNQGQEDAEEFTVNIVWSDDDTIGNEDDLVVAVETIADGLAAGASTSVTVPAVQLDREVLFQRAIRDDPPGAGADFESVEADFLAIVINDPVPPAGQSSQAGSFSAEQGTNIDDVTSFPWDLDRNGQVTPTDAIFVVNRLGQTGAEADINGDGQVTPTDAIAVVNRLGYSRNDAVFEEQAVMITTIIIPESQATALAEATTTPQLAAWDLTQLSIQSAASLAANQPSTSQSGLGAEPASSMNSTQAREQVFGALAELPGPRVQREQDLQVETKVDEELLDQLAEDIFEQIS